MRAALQAGNDQSLLKTRGGVLESAGLRVVNADGLQDALDQLQPLAFDLLILCHSLAEAERTTITAAARRCNPRIRVLLVGIGRDLLDSPPAGVDALLDAHPQRLVRG